MTPMGHRYFLFPHLFLREKDVRRLSILLSRLGILQVLRGPVLPSCSGERIDAWPVISDSEDLERIRLYLKGYFDFAEQLGEKGLLACRSWIALAGEDPESRFRIQGRVRGEGSEEEARKERLLLEAAIFHEIARNLDEKELEVVSGIVEVERLEEEFRRILGIETGEEAEETMDGTTPSLGSENADFSFLVLKRAGFWYRLLSNHPPEMPWVPVAFSQNLLEEILESVQTRREKNGQAMEIQVVPLCTIPSLESLEPEEFASLRGDLEEHEIQLTFWNALDRFLENPEDSLLLETLQKEGSLLEAHLQDFVEKNRVAGGGQVRMNLVRLKDCTHREVWENLDPEGFAELGTNTFSWTREALFLGLSEGPGRISRMPG
ncbi:MAG: hypothetical protein KBH99_05735 [Syntrophobacteraceae bacterium]|nr:hypothetical protein [Syntrophobacteraceae bacterium]